MSNWTIHHGDCLEVLRTMADASVDAVVTDPPYGLSFMGKKWDYDVPSVDVWRECLRVLKPGGHLLAFAGTRTQHRMAVRIEDAGFEIRDMIAWVYSQGFPKSMDVSKSIDKAAGAEREIVGTRAKRGALGGVAYAQDDWTLAQANKPLELPVTEPATDAARKWSGWGTALKPAMEPITVARKPLIGTVAANVLAHGTGAINVDGCRVGTDGGTRRDGKANKPNDAGWENMRGHGIASLTAGRWPANMVHDGSEEVLAGFPDANGSKPGSFQRVKTSRGLPGGGFGQERANMRDKTDLQKPGYEDSGSAARFFYCAKASKSDRNDGCKGVLTWEGVDLSQETEHLLQLARDTSDSTMLLLADSEWLTTLSGSSTTDQSLRAIRSITEITSRLITGLRTSNFLPHLNTKDFILDATRTILETGSSLAESADSTSRLRSNTTSAEMASALGVVSAVLSVLCSIKERARIGNAHSTVKPTDLMRYLVRLVTPPGGVVLDPFMGSGSTGRGAILEGFRFIGIEREAEYVKIAEARIKAAADKHPVFNKK